STLRLFTLDHQGRYAFIHCRLKTERFDPPLAMDLRFDGVSSVQIKGVGGGILSQITGFAVVDISAKGWEGINWEAIDYEEGRIRWYAEDFQILDVVRV
ncbi:hypothetical protein ACKGJN_16955, partial [Gillisia sp. Q332]